MATLNLRRIIVSKVKKVNNSLRKERVRNSGKYAITRSFTKQ